MISHGDPQADGLEKLKQSPALGEQVQGIALIICFNYPALDDDLALG